MEAGRKATAKNMAIKVTLKLDKEEVALVDRAYESLGLTPRGGGGPSWRAQQVLRALLEQWDAASDDAPPEEPVEVPSAINEAIRSITDPNISLGVRVRESSVTPLDTDGLVPWAYVVEGYSNLSFVAETARDYTNKGERRVSVLRVLLTQIPEDQWESEQTRSLVARALAALEVSGVERVSRVERIRSKRG